MALNTAVSRPNTNNVLQASAQNVGIDRGSCSWYERPLTGNHLGDRLQIVDMDFSVFTWTGAEWGNSTVMGKANPLTGGITKIEVLTQAMYDALAVKDPETNYKIVAA